ncbi:oligoribonuclease [Neodiprion virginianus]|uniref:oligoribonuclease n=1 Tax=Neodiprion fabricii TaxID=2872261 RepID=UPI001ED90AF1|nr:oligoribonuclease [Neodiprion fabricii]XP_046620153.1 oligoribonuclease [Neodiprion virginianus]
MYVIQRGLQRSLHGKDFLSATWSMLRYTFDKSTHTSRCASPSVDEASALFSTSAFFDAANKNSSKKITMDDRLVWIDMEMTGLNVEKCHIMEIACLISDSNLNIVSDDFHVVVHQPDDILEAMNDWCIAQHAKTGLTAESRASKVSLREAEELTLEFLKTNVPEKLCPVAGNSVWMDRVFIQKYLPLVHNYVHYRIIDVSTIKELMRRWCPNQYARVPAKKFNHRALDDIKESINELKYYKSQLFDVANLTHILERPENSEGR